MADQLDEPSNWRFLARLQAIGGNPGRTLPKRNYTNLSKRRSVAIVAATEPSQCFPRSWKPRLLFPPNSRNGADKNTMRTKSRDWYSN